MSHAANKPPRPWVRLMARLFPDHNAFSTLGDLEEVFQHIAARDGIAAANRWYRGQALRAIPPFIANTIYWNANMLKNYLVSASRHLRHHPLYAGINVFGLSIAIAFAILVLLFVRSENSYDRFHPESDRIYRLATAVHFQELEYWENTPFPLATALVDEVPGVESTSRFTILPSRPVRIGDRRVEVDVHMASPDFFDMFRFPLASGDNQRVLRWPQDIVISDDIRRQYFRDEVPIGKVIEVNLRDSGKVSFTVAGVAAPIPENSSIRFDFLIPESRYGEAFGEGATDDWLPKSRTVTFFRAARGADLGAMQSALNSLSREHGLDRFLAGADVENLIAIENLERIHFSSLINNTILAANGDPTYGYTLIAVALLVLAIACINFMNLSVGLSAGRSREVGVRKVLGARRGQLVQQFWFESLLLTAVALIAGLALAALLLPTFNQLSGKALSFGAAMNLEAVTALVGLGLVVGLIAGAYPALILSGFRPTAVLKGKLWITGRSYLSRALVAGQFAISIFLIACSLVMGRQLAHISALDPGYDAELLLLQSLPRGADDALVERYRRQATQDPNVVGVSGARATLFGDAVASAFMIERDGAPMTIAASKIDYDFLDVMGIPLIAGRNLSPDFPTDQTDAILVNEAFVDRFELVDPVGQKAPFGNDNDPQIVGVVSDFHFMSLRHRIEPLVMNLRPNSDYRQIITRIRGTSIPATLAKLEHIWNGLDSGTLFSYEFVDDGIRNQYRAEENFRAISSYAAWMATLIACLGLFGMAALSVARRTKEMGIRKVLGASSERIMLHFHREYIVLLVVGAAIAWPLARYMMDRWLQRFAEPVGVGWSALILATGIVFTVAALTVTGQALRAARKNPVQSLRYE